MRSLGLFVLSACLAITLSFFVHGQRNNVQRVIVMPVELHNKPHDKYVSVDLSSRQIQVTVQGPSFLVADMALANRSIKVELPEGVNDRFSTAINDSMLDIPQGLSIVHIEPKKIQVTVDNIMKKRVPVVVLKEGVCKRKISSFTVIPDYIEIEGAEKEVSKVESVRTTVLNMGKIENDVNVRLQIADKWSSIQSKTTEVIVMLKLAPEETFRVFKQVEVEVRSKKPRRVVVSPNHVWVKVSGPKQVIENLVSDDVTAYVKLGASFQSSNKVRFDVPQGVSVLGWKPTIVDVVQDEHGEVTVNKREVGIETASPSVTAIIQVE